MFDYIYIWVFSVPALFWPLSDIQISVFTSFYPQESTFYYTKKGGCTGERGGVEVIPFLLSSLSWSADFKSTKRETISQFFLLFSWPAVKMRQSHEFSETGVNRHIFGNRRQDQGLRSCTLKSTVNTVLLKHRRPIHLTYFLWLLLLHNGRDEQLQQRNHGSQSLKYLLHGPKRHKAFGPLGGT